MIPLIVIALAAGMAVGWKVRGRRCGVLCDPPAASRTLAEHHADGYELGVRDAARYERGSLEDSAALRRVRSVLHRPRVTVEDPQEQAAGAAA